MTCPSLRPALPGLLVALLTSTTSVALAQEDDELLDDHGNDAAQATLIEPGIGYDVSIDGLIGDAGDVDVFAFDTLPGMVRFSVTPYVDLNEPSETWVTLDAALELRDPAGTLLAVDAPGAGIDPTIQYSLNQAGTYYVHVRPAGSGDPAMEPSAGYATFGPTGHYQLAGAVISPNTSASTSGETPTLITIPPEYQPTTCQDSCIHQNNDVCEDGGPGAQVERCAYGTDCADCGQRVEADALRFDTCVSARNGVCEDGVAQTPALCARGTDYADCGARYSGTPPGADGEESDEGWLCNVGAPASGGRGGTLLGLALLALGLGVRRPRARHH